MESPNLSFSGHFKVGARAHQDWLLPQWRNVLFSDESRFGLVSDDYREKVWRERGGQNRLATAIGRWSITKKISSKRDENLAHSEWNLRIRCSFDAIGGRCHDPPAGSQSSR
nr:unnamed protein product [Callosobruchus chinensis]